MSGAGAFGRRDFSLAFQRPFAKIGGMKNRFVFGLLAGLVVLALPLATARQSAVAQSAETAVRPAYVTSSRCVACHEEVAARWRDSHHAWAWRTPSPETVLGDFDGASLTLDGVTMSFRHDDDGYKMVTEKADGTTTVYDVVGTVGVTPLQQYLVEKGSGHLQVPDAAWDSVAGRWYDLYPGQDIDESDGLHWLRSYKSWNARCAECHATDFSKNYDPQSHSYASREAEIGVGCEACHGPGEAHVAWAEAPATYDPSAWPESDAKGLVARFSAGRPDVEIQLCAGCHSRREPLGAASPLPGTPYADSYLLSTMRPGLYQPDGQILDEVYVYGSFLQSRMYAKGVRCSNCHEPHGGTLRAEGNGLCAQCHSPAGNPEFPSLTLKAYDSPAHHFHEPGTPGAACTSCHMPERFYMVVDGRRDHGFRVPRPDLSVALGVPNACTACHDDRTAEWATEVLATRFPDSRHRGDHFAGAFAAAWRGDGSPATREALLGIAADEAQAAFVRASALDALRPYADAAVAERTAALLGNAHPLLRGGAIALQRPLAPEVRLQRVVPLLQDPMRSVRIEAVRGLIDLIAAGADLGDGGPAVQEFQASLVATADFPETQMVIAGTSLVFRNYAAAASAFAEAVRMDPQLVPAWRMIARIKAASGDLVGAAKSVREGLSFNPGDAVLKETQKQIKDALTAE